MVVARYLLPMLCAIASAAHSHEVDGTTEIAATVKAMFPEQTAGELAVTLDAETVVRFRIRVPVGGTPAGILVFVKPVDSGAIPQGWAPALDAHNLIWIAADDFGNRRPSAQRVLVALMALKLIQNTQTFDPKRVYIGGMSGGGRIASQVITRFPQRFTGAVYIAGADYFMPTGALKPQVTAKRYVFITGARDFNLEEMKVVYGRYRRAGVTGARLVNLPNLGHEYPSPEELGKAVDFLDKPQPGF